MKKNIIGISGMIKGGRLGYALCQIIVFRKITPINRIRKYPIF